MSIDVFVLRYINYRLAIITPYENKKTILVERLCIGIT